MNKIMMIVIFSLLFFTCMGFAAFTVRKYWMLIKKGQPREIKTPFMARINSVMVNVIFQKKLMKHPVRGIFHIFIFYGFILYSLFHTPSQFIGGFIGEPTFYLPTIIENLLGFRGLEMVYDYMIDVASLLVLSGLAYFGGRRWITRAKELDRPSGQSAIVLSFIAFLMIFTLIGESAKMFAHPELNIDVTHLSPVRTFIQGLYTSANLTDQATANVIYMIGWWGHIACVLAFAAFVPSSKHSHLIWGPVNFFIQPDTPKGAIPFLDTENAPVWGAANVQHFEWTSLVDSLACIECGRCTIQCPANRTDKPLNPKKIMTDLKHAVMEKAPNLIAAVKEGKEGEDFLNLEGTRVIDDYTSQDELWGCTTCYACVEACPVGNNQVEAILAMRRSLVLNEGAMPAELQGALTNIENQSNPWGIGAHKREDWIEGLNVKTMAQWKELGEKPDILFWVGCAGAFDDRSMKISKSIVNILNAANMKFGILGNEEQCTGDSARRAGNEYLYQTLAQGNIDKFKDYEVTKILASCPHCFNTLKNEYPQLGGHYEVVHHTDLINELVEEGRITIDKEKAKELGEVVYHDSCYLGRYNDTYDAPREAIKKVTGVAVKEPSDTKSKGLCCGAGGAQMWMEEQNENRVNEKRTNQLTDTGAKTIASACPFCMTMVSDGLKSTGKEEDVKILDVAEIVDQAVTKA